MAKQERITHERMAKIAGRSVAWVKKQREIVVEPLWLDKLYGTGGKAHTFVQYEWQGRPFWRDKHDCATDK